MNNPHLRMCRKIHPVGQGAMYSESFYEGDEPMMVVLYDCGAKNHKECLEREIKSLGRADHLFISHFHYDHISGVKRLISEYDLKSIHIPRVTPSQFLFDIVCNVLAEGTLSGSISFMYSVLQVLSNPEEHGGRHDSMDNRLDNLWDGVERHSHGVPVIRLHSGGTCYADVFRGGILWCYDVIENTCQSREEIDLMAEILDLLHIAYVRDSDKFQPEAWYKELVAAFNDKKNLDAVKSLYAKKFPGGHNSYSMMVHSHRYVFPPEIDSPELHDFDCLYTGDAEPTESNVDEIVRIAPRYIQVPHHGSGKNHVSRIYHSHQTAFISVGENNHYHHPSLCALDEIVNTCAETHVVTEKGQAYEKEYVFV